MIPGSILIFVPTLNGGGAERVLVNLANGLAARGVDVHLVAGLGGVFERDVVDSVQLSVLGSPRAAACVPGLVRILRREKPQVLLAAMPHGNLAAYMSHRLARSRSMLAMSVHSHHVSDGSWYTRFISRAVVHAYEAADIVICVSRGVQTSVRAVTDIRSLTTIYNPIGPPSGTELGRAAGRDPRLLVAAGRLVSQKDYPTMLRAFAKVRQHMDAHLVIVGTGPLLSDLAEQAQLLGVADAVDFKGFVDDPGYWMARAQAFVLSSEREGFGNVLVEAMHAGAAIVSTDCPSGPREILADGLYGDLVPVGDVTALATAIERALVRGPARNMDEPLKLYNSDKIVGEYMMTLNLFR